MACEQSIRALRALRLVVVRGDIPPTQSTANRRLADHRRGEAYAHLFTYWLRQDAGSVFMVHQRIVQDGAGADAG